MQEREARLLRQTWGDKPCGHPAWDHLVLGNIHDGYVCIRCGQEFTQEQRDRMIASRKTETAQANVAPG